MRRWNFSGSFSVLIKRKKMGKSQEFPTAAFRLMPLTVFSGGTVKAGLEFFPKVAGASETAGGANVGDGGVCVDQEVADFSQTVVHQIGEWADTQVFFEASAAFTDADIAGVGNLLKGQFLGVMGGDVSHHGFQAFIFVGAEGGVVRILCEGENQPPDLGHGFSYVELVAFLFFRIEIIGLTEKFYDFFMLRDGGIEAKQVQTGIVGNWQNIALGQHAVLASADELREKDMLFLERNLAFRAAGHMKNAGIDESAFAFQKCVGTAGESIIQLAFAHIKEFHIIMPMPGKSTLGNGVQTA